jgi:hypothetical protein
VPSWPRDTPFLLPIRLARCYLHACGQCTPSSAVLSIYRSGLSLSLGYRWYPSATRLGRGPAQRPGPESPEGCFGSLLPLSPAPMLLPQLPANQRTKPPLPCTLQISVSFQSPISWGSATTRGRAHRRRDIAARITSLPDGESLSSIPYRGGQNACRRRALHQAATRGRR